MKKLIYTFTILLLMLTSCSNYGEKIEFNGTEVYYREGVTIEQAEQLAQYLAREGFTDGNRKSVQLLIDENSGNLTFRMVISKGAAYNPNNDVMFESFTRNLSKEFKQPVDFHLCDNSFKTLKRFDAENVSKLLMAKATQLLYTKNISKETAQKLADYLIESGFADATPITIQLDKQNDTLQYKMVVQPGKEKEESYALVLKAFSENLSNKVFNQAPVQAIMCDNNFQVLKIIK